jgi:hypothetical protein
VTVGLSTIGEWDRALVEARTLRNLEKVGALKICLRQVGRQLRDDVPALHRQVSEFVAASDGLEAKEQAAIRAIACQILLPTDQEAARRNADDAARLCLSRLPDGDTDELLALFACARHMEGDLSGANGVVRRMYRASTAVDTLADLAGKCDVRDDRNAYAQALVRELHLRRGAQFYEVSLYTVAAALLDLAEKGCDLVPDLCTAIADHRASLSLLGRARCLGPIAAVRSRDGSADGARLFHELATEIRSVGSEAWDRWAAMSSLLDSVLKVAPDLGDQLYLILEMALEVAESSTTGGRVAIESHYALALAASGDVRQAYKRLIHLIHYISQPSSPGPIHFMRMVAELHGDLIGANPEQATIARTIALAANRLGSWGQPEAVLVLKQVFDAVLRIESQEDRAQALVHLFKSIGSGPLGMCDAVASMAKNAAAMLRSWPVGLQNPVWSTAVAALCELKCIEQASAVANEADVPIRERLRLDISVAQASLELGELDVFETTAVRLAERNRTLAHQALYFARDRGKAHECLRIMTHRLMDKDFMGSRGSILKEFLPIAILMRSVGSEQIDRMIGHIEMTDGGFIQAANLVGSSKQMARETRI